MMVERFVSINSHGIGIVTSTMKKLFNTSHNYIVQQLWTTTTTTTV